MHNRLSLSGLSSVGNEILFIFASQGTRKSWQATRWLQDSKYENKSQIFEQKKSNIMFYVKSGIDIFCIIFEENTCV